MNVKKTKYKEITDKLQLISDRIEAQKQRCQSIDKLSEHSDSLINTEDAF
jgi:hypothetical protein